LLGHAIREFGRESVSVCTKLGTHPIGSLGSVRKSFCHKDLEYALQVSLTRLGVDQLDALLLHSPGDVDMDQGMDFLERAKGLGRTRLIGASIEPSQWQQPAIARCDVVMLRSWPNDDQVGSAVGGLRSAGKFLIAKQALRRRSPGLQSWLPRGLRRADVWYWAREWRDTWRGVHGSEPARDQGPPGTAIAETLMRFDSLVFGSTRVSHIAANAQAALAAGLDLRAGVAGVAAHGTSTGTMR
jgi:hypothetical protein